MASDEDSVVDRAQRVRRSLEGAGDPRSVQAAIGGPCPRCGERVEIVVHADTDTVSCSTCQHVFPVRSEREDDGHP